MKRLMIWIGVTVLVLVTQSFNPFSGGDAFAENRGKPMMQPGKTVTVRDRNGTIIEQKTRRGNTVYVRDRNGRLLRTETR